MHETNVVAYEALEPLFFEMLVLTRLQPDADHVEL